MSFINKVSLATIALALGNVIVVLIAQSATVATVSAICAWIVVITTQLGLIAVRMRLEEKEKSDI